MEIFNLKNCKTNGFKTIPTVTLSRNDITISSMGARLMALKPGDRVGFIYDSGRLYITNDPNGFIVSAERKGLDAVRFQNNDFIQKIRKVMGRDKFKAEILEFRDGKRELKILQ